MHHSEDYLKGRPVVSGSSSVNKPTWSNPLRVRPCRLFLFFQGSPYFQSRHNATIRLRGSSQPCLSRSDKVWGFEVSTQISRQRWKSCRNSELRVNDSDCFSRYDDKARLIQRGKAMRCPCR